MAADHMFIATILDFIQNRAQHIPRFRRADFLFHGFHHLVPSTIRILYVLHTCYRFDNMEGDQSTARGAQTHSTRAQT